MIELTVSTAAEILDGLVEEFGDDYVYDADPSGQCDYVRDGKPSCIVGHVLAKVGVPIERLKAADTATLGGGMAVGALLAKLKEEGVIQFDGSVRNLLGEAQYNQDNRRTWADSVQAAKNCAGI